MRYLFESYGKKNSALKYDEKSVHMSGHPAGQIIADIPDNV